MSKLFNWAAARIVAAFAFALPLAAMAEIQKTNPVTGETENYTWKFAGTDTWDGTGNWQNSSGASPSGTPAKSGENTWDPILFDNNDPGNTININASMSVEGWNLRMGLYNGANVTMNTFVKYQGDTTMWMTVDENSQLTIGGFGGGNITANQAIKLSVAKANGITWNVNLTSGNANNTFEYYLKGAGSVSYQAVSAANHKIKMADVTLTGTSQVSHKTLVSFTSSSQTFTADAAIKVLDSNGDQVATKALSTVNTTGTTTLTTDNTVGTCELVQTSTGIDLYWVDGDPANLPAATVYKPSININFTNGAANGLTTQADVGLSGYEVPGTSWNNYVVANSTFSSVNAIDSTGAASAMSGVSVTISNVSGSWGCSGLTASSDFRQSYIDESASYPTPTVTVSGIPYYKYRVLVYHSTDTKNVPFGYDTINGTNYTYVNDALAEGTTAWGDSGAKDSANAIAEGGNVLVTEALSGSTLTVVGHRAGGANNARGCIAAIQIVEVKADVGENDLEIPVAGDTPYTVEETKELSGTVYLTGSGTLTLAGENKISAATIDVGDLVTLVVNADRLDGTTFTGGGTVVYNNALPVTGKGWTDSSAWTGTVWINGKSGVTDFNVNSYGNANSSVKLSGVDGWISAPFDNTVPVILENGEFEYALKLTNGNSPNNQYPKRCTTFVKVSGSGTISDGGSANPMLKIYDGTKFTGALTLTRARVVFCAADSTTLPDAYNTGIPAASIYVDSGNSATVASGKTWTADGGFVVNGTLNANGTLASSLATKAVSGTGTVVFGGVPSPTGDAWWKNAAWTGTVEIKGATALNGDYAFNDYGNSGSTLKLTNCSGWLKPNYTCVPALEIGGTFTWNDGSSGLNNTFKVATLKGSGTISIPNQGAATAVWQITENWLGFTGAVVGNNGAAKRILVFGSTLPTTATAGVIYVSEGATLDLDNASSAWWGVGMGFVVDGTVKASARNKWGGGTYMKLGDTGVLELVTGAEYVHDAGTSFSNVTGTGTVRYTGSNWRSLPDGDNMFATTLSIELENDAGVVFNGGSTDGSTGTIGGLFGTKNLRTDLGGYSKVLTVKQAKDGLWSGIISAGDRLDTFIVDPGETTTGTLTLAGTHTSDNKLTVNGSVNLTGTWKGATTVAGTFGGTGTLTGDLTFSDGATLKANASALTVSGTVTLPTGDGESLTIDATGLDADEVTILSSESITTETDVSKVNVDGLYTVTPVAGAIKLVSTKVAVTVPVVAHATATVTVGGTPVEPTTEGGNVYKVAPDSTVTVVYAADAGYTFGDGKVEYTIDTATATTFVLDESTKAAQYIAKIVDGASYTSLQSAFDALENNNKVVLLATTDEGATIPSKSFAFYFYAGSFECGEIADAEGSFVTTSSDETIEIDSVEVTAKKYRVAAAVALVTLSGAAEGTYYGDYMSAYNDFLAGAAGTTMQVFGENPFSTDIPCTTYDTTTQTYTKLEAVASRVVSQMPINYPSLAAAIEAAEAGDTITLLADDRVSFTEDNLELSIDKALTINGAGYTIYGVNAYAGGKGDHDIYISGSGDVTIKNVTLAEFGGAVANNMRTYPIWTGSAYTGTLTLDNVTVRNFNRTAFNLNGGTVVVKDCTITGDKSKDTYFQSGIEAYNANVTVQGTTTITGTGSNLVDWPEAACLQLGNPNGPVAGTGSITVTGGTFTGDYGIIVASNASEVVSVTGGTFNGVLEVEDGEGGSLAISGGTFNAVVPEEYLAEGYEVLDNGDGTYGVREDKGWIYAAPGYWNYTGTWSEGATLGEEKVTIEDGATYTASEASDGRFVTVAMTLSFDDANDDDDDFGDAKAAIRLASGETDGTYQFQLYTSDGANNVWTNATVVGVTATKEVDYNFVIVLDLTNKIYTASVVTDAGATTNALTIGENVTEIPFACQGEITPVQQIDFVGAGKVSSIEGSYETPEEPPAPEGFDEDDTIGEVTLTAEQATWLNEQNNYDELAAKIATMTADAFNNAYLLNLNVTDPAYDGTFTFEVTDFTVDDTTVSVKVTLTRKGELEGPINGTLKLTGTDELGHAFEVKDSATISDAHFSAGDGTVTISFTKDVNTKFFKPVIE